MKIHRNWPPFLSLVLALSVGMSALCANPRESASPGQEKAETSPDETRPEGPPPRGRNPHAGFFSKLSAEERAEIDQLARSNNQAELRKKMRELFQKYRPPEAKLVDELSEKYLAAKTDAEKTTIKAELEKAVRVQFQKRLEFTKNNITSTEEQLEKAKKDLDRLKIFYQNSQKDSEKIIRERVEQMCLPKEKRKKTSWGDKSKEPRPFVESRPPQPPPNE